MEPKVFNHFSTRTCRVWLTPLRADMDSLGILDISKTLWPWRGGGPYPVLPYPAGPADPADPADPAYPVFSPLPYPAGPLPPRCFLPLAYPVKGLPGDPFPLKSGQVWRVWRKWPAEIVAR